MKEKSPKSSSKSKKSTETIKADANDLILATSLKQQKTTLKYLLEELRISDVENTKQIISNSTIQTTIDSSDETKKRYGEIAGYYNGYMTRDLDLFDTAITNLEKFEDGEFDDLNHGQRGMFISLWYSLASSASESIKNTAAALQDIESDAIGLLNESENIQRPQTYH